MKKLIFISFVIVVFFSCKNPSICECVELPINGYSYPYIYWANDSILGKDAISYFNPQDTINTNPALYYFDDWVYNSINTNYSLKSNIRLSMIGNEDLLYQKEIFRLNYDSTEITFNNKKYILKKH